MDYVVRCFFVIAIVVDLDSRWMFVGVLCDALAFFAAVGGLFVLILSRAPATVATLFLLHIRWFKCGGVWRFDCWFALKLVFVLLVEFAGATFFSRVLF